MSKYFTCYLCKKTYKKDCSDEEAMEDFRNNFPDCPEELSKPVCGWCFEDNERSREQRKNPH